MTYHLYAPHRVTREAGISTLSLDEIIESIADTFATANTATAAGFPVVPAYGSPVIIRDDAGRTVATVYEDGTIDRPTVADTLRALEALRRSEVAPIARRAEAISARLALFNRKPSAGDYFAELDAAERFVARHSMVEA